MCVFYICKLSASCVNSTWISGSEIQGAAGGQEVVSHWNHGCGLNSSEKESVCPLCARHLLYAPIGTFYFFVFLLHRLVSGWKPGSAGSINLPQMPADRQYDSYCKCFSKLFEKVLSLSKLGACFHQPHSSMSNWKPLADLKTVLLKTGACEILDTEMSYSTATV